MRFAVIQETDWLTRGPHQQHHLFDRLSARGHEITVLDFEIQWKGWPASPLVVRRQEWPGVSRIIPEARVRVVRPATIHLWPVCRPSSLVTHALDLSQLIRERRPDAIVNYALSTGLAAEQLAHRAGIPFVFHVIDSLHTIVPSRLLQPIALAAERRLLRRADRTVYINEGLREYGVALGAQPNRAVALRSGVDLKRIRPDLDGSALRAQLGFAQGDFVLFFMGWLYRFAGLFELFEALPAAPPEIKLLVVGDGEAYEELRRAAARLSLNERIVFTGRQPYDRMPEFLAAADVCLLPSHVNEVTRHIVPVKVYEYLASGRPVVSSRLPGVMRDVPEGEGVLYAAPGEHLKMASALRDATRRHELGARGRAFVEAHCDWERITDEFEELLRVAGQRISSGEPDAPESVGGLEPIR